MSRNEYYFICLIPFVSIFFDFVTCGGQFINLFYRSDSTRNQCECGLANKTPSPKIVNGFQVGQNEYPWLALLLYNGTFVCGGTLISDLFVLSAGHCLVDGFDQRKLKVKLGENDICDYDTSTTTFSVNRILRHPKYNGGDFTADIMLLRLSMRVEFGKFAKPICLPHYEANARSGSRYEGKRAQVLGWGKPYHGAPKASCLPKKLQVPVLNRTFCSDVTRTLFCAGYLNGEGDSCQGDSGGPLQWKNRDKYEIIGIVSNGIGCAVPGKPGLYTDVLRYLPWIVRNIGESSFCS